jgi:hypothetical protein
MLVADHKRAHVRISQALNGDAERSKHVNIGNKLLPIDLARP